MAFVYEKLNEQDKEFVASFKFLHPLDSYSLAKIPIHWAADRERNIFLVCLGGQGFRFHREFPPTYYRLIWDGQPIRIEAFYNSEGNRTAGRKITLLIDHIEAPNTLKVDTTLLIDTVKDAFETYERGSGKYISSIEFIEIANPLFVKRRYFGR